MVTQPCSQWWLSDVTGWLASRDNCPTSGCHGCTSSFSVKSSQPIQLRFHSFHLFSGEYVEIREGTTATDRLIGRFTSNHRPSRVVEVAGNGIFVSFKSVSVHDSPAFNFTYQPKGMFPTFLILTVFIIGFLARDSMLSALYAIANPSVCLSDCLSVTRVDQSKTVEVRIMQFSLYSSPISLVFALQVSSRNSDGIPPSGVVKQWWVVSMQETSYFRSSNAFARWLLNILSQLLQTYSPGGRTVVL